MPSQQSNPAQRSSGPVAMNWAVYCIVTVLNQLSILMSVSLACEVSVFQRLALCVFSSVLPSSVRRSFSVGDTDPTLGPSHITEASLSTQFCQGCECHWERQLSRLSHSVYTEYFYDVDGEESLSPL